MMTAGEFRSNPREAIMIEHINNQALAPCIRLLFLIAMMVPSRSRPFWRSRSDWNQDLRLLIFFVYQFTIRHLQATIAHIGQLQIVGDDDEGLLEVATKVKKQLMQFL